MELSIGKIIDALDCEVALEPADRGLVVRDITWDSRKVAAQGAFLAMVGEKVDGNSFIPAAVESGASLVIATKDPEAAALDAAKAKGTAIAVVPEPIEAMSALARLQRDELDCRVIGVTGSSGKTTTKDLIATVMSARFATVATAANQNNELGVPATVLNANASTEALIVEMGMRGFHQIEGLCAFVRPNIGVITNIGVAHEELLGSQDNIAKAKSELISALPDGEGIAILNGDDPFTPRVMEVSAAKERGIEALLYGQSEGCDVRAENVNFTEEGQPSFDIVLPDGSRSRASLSIMGAHNVGNSLAAAAVGYACGMDVETICTALATAQSGHMRQEVVYAQCGAKIINDAYNANPDSASAALRLLAIMAAEGRKIAVLGDMLELGPNAPALHRGVGELAASLGIDMVVAVGELSANIAQGARETAGESIDVLEFSDAEAAAEGLKGIVASKDLVLLKASRGMELEKIAKGLVD